MSKKNQLLKSRY